MSSAAVSGFPIPAICVRHSLILQALGATAPQCVRLRTLLVSLVANNPQIMERCGFVEDGTELENQAALRLASGIITELAPLCCYVGDAIYAECAGRVTSDDGRRPRG